MRIRIDAHEASQLKRSLVPAPVEIKAPWVGVDFDRNAMCGASNQNVFDIDVVSCAPQQLAPGHVAKDCSKRVFYSADDTLRLEFRIQLETAVDACDHEVKARHYVVRIIKRAVSQNVGFDTFENT